jgi:hypothetical protein
MTKLVLSARALVRPPNSLEVLAWFDVMFGQQTNLQSCHKAASKPISRYRARPTS